MPSLADAVHFVHCEQRHARRLERLYRLFLAKLFRDQKQKLGITLPDTPKLAVLPAAHQGGAHRRRLCRAARLDQLCLVLFARNRRRHKQRIAPSKQRTNGFFLSRPALETQQISRCIRSRNVVKMSLGHGPRRIN